MSIDPFKAIWVSHSSMGDFLKCPRAYYLHNIYKDPETRRKINIVNPYLSLGVSVHEVLEGLAKYKSEDRFKIPLLKHFESSWKKVKGEIGGFKSKEEEEEFRQRALSMLQRVEKNPGPLLHKTVKIKIKSNDIMPNIVLSEKDNLILCGKIDWLIWRSEDDSVHILDFKTGKHEESDESLQLPIYQLLLKELQKRNVTGASYWYIDRDDEPISVKLPTVEESLERVMKVALAIKEARKNGVFICEKGECFYCRPFERVLRGEARYLGVGEMKQDLYMLQ
jgi:ATP-dependent helicase/DNAse subunit B